MRNPALFLLAAAVMAATITTAAQAQSATCSTLVANIPFEFSVGEKTLPAGRYSVSCTNPYSDQRVLRLRSEDGRYGALVQTIAASGKPDGSARMVFRRYEDTYFFASVWMSANSSGFESRKCRPERRIARQLAGTSPRLETVALLSR